MWYTLSAIRSLLLLSGMRRVLSATFVRESEECAGLGGPVTGCERVLKPLRRVCSSLPPLMFLGWEMCPNVFPEKTPEESDDYSTLDENRLLSDIPG